MNREELIQSLIEKMRAVMKSMHAGHGFPFGEFMLNMPQVRILFSISHKKDGLSVKELAEMLHVTPGAVTQLVDPLVEKDLVRRDEDPFDRRILRIKLTHFAKNKFEKFRSDYLTSANQLFTVLSDAEIEQLLALLNKINTQSGIKENKK